MSIFNSDSFNLNTSIGNCISYDFSKFENTFKSIKGCFLVMNFNIRSFNRNIDEFLLFLDNLIIKPSVVVLTETWFSDNNFQNINGYKSFHSYRLNRIGGGVSIFITNELPSSEVSIMNMNNDNIELCGVSLNISRIITIKLLAFYRPPSGNVGEFISVLEGHLSLFRSSDRVLICGDANIDMLSDNSNCNDYADLFVTRGILPCISLPTRVSANSSTID